MSRSRISRAYWYSSTNQLPRNCEEGQSGRGLCLFFWHFQPDLPSVTARPATGCRFEKKTIGGCSIKTLSASVDALTSALTSWNSLLSLFRSSGHGSFSALTTFLLPNHPGRINHCIVLTLVESKLFFADESGHVCGSARPGGNIAAELTSDGSSTRQPSNAAAAAAIPPCRSRVSIVGKSWKEGTRATGQRFASRFEEGGLCAQN